MVTLRIDSRVFYGLVAVVAVLGIFAIGWWIGTQLNSPAQAPADAPAVAGNPPVEEQPPGLQVQPGQPGAVEAERPAVEKGSIPVSPDDVPVGENQPRIWVGEQSPDNDFTFDFGTVPAGEPTEQEFVVTNIGTGEVVIEGASASCGCTAAVVDDSTLAAGESTIVRVAYDPRVNQEQGRFVQKQVRIRSNDPVTPLVEFTITADVAAE